MRLNARKMSGDARFKSQVQDTGVDAVDSVAVAVVAVAVDDAMIGPSL
jgi:hypothetical protein